MASTEYNIPIWPGSSSFTAGNTPFGIYDNDTSFQTDIDKFATYCALRLGYPITDIELQDVNFYASFEQAIAEYSSLVNQSNIKDNILYITGAPTSTNLTQKPVYNNLDFLITLSQDYGSEAGVGGTISWRTGSIAISSGQQTYDLNALVRDTLHPTDNIEIKRVFHNAPPAISRYFDPFIGTGMGSQNLLGEFGFGGMSPAVTFMMMPMYADLLRLQAIEFNDQIRKSAYGFEIINNNLKIFPLPTSNFTLHFEYILKSDRANPNRFPTTGSLVSDISNAPYNFIPYENINSVGKNWIFTYGLACAMELLGWVRSKYSSVPIPNADITLNGPELISTSQTIKQDLIEKLRADLDVMSRRNQMEKAAEEAQFLNDQIGKIPLKIYIGAMLPYILALPGVL
jgi:hypothetical protein